MRTWFDSAKAHATERTAVYPLRATALSKNSFVTQTKLKRGLDGSAASDYHNDKPFDGVDAAIHIVLNNAMFLLRIAEALVASQESHLQSSIASQLSTEGSIEMKAPATTFCSVLSDEQAANEPMLEGSEKLSRIRLSCSLECSTPSPRSVTTVSARTISPNSSSASPHLAMHSPTSSVTNSSPTHCRVTGQLHQGLLYNLLVNSETSRSQSRSPLPCTSPLLTPVGSSSPAQTPSSLKMMTKSSDAMVEDVRVGCTGTVELGTAVSNTLVSWPSLTSKLKDVVTHSDHRSQQPPFSNTVRLATVHSNSRHRTNSFGCKTSVTRPYSRPHASSVGAASDLYPAIKLKLQSCRQSQVAEKDASILRSRLSLRYRTISKSQENTFNPNGSADAGLHCLSVSQSQLTNQQSSSLSSPRIPLQTQSAQARLMTSSGLTPPVCTSYSSSGYCSAGATHSPIPSSQSADSGLDEPVDLTSGLLPNPVSQQQPPRSLPSTLMTTTFSDLTKPITSRIDSPHWVQLAKKTARPVQARITEWLRQVTEFVALSAPLMSTMKLGQFPSSMSSRSTSLRRNELNGHGPDRDMEFWLSLLAGCWHRLLALSMVENALDLVVVEDKSTHVLPVAGDADMDQCSIPWLLFFEKNGLELDAIRLAETSRPDRQFATGLAQLMSELRQAALSPPEFYLLRHVVLLTAQEPSAIPTLGLNVIRASRCIQARSESPPTVKVTSSLWQNGSGNGLSADCVTNTTSSPDKLQSTNLVPFDLACLVSGLKALSTLCPYGMANLFCTHLRTGSPSLNRTFLLELHARFGNAMSELNGTRPPVTQIVELDEVCADEAARNGTSILEQLFDSS
ncbi:hypothetical protein PHET_04977 [Paragonimus heterotremus]|uniref:Uncharacterized protein n=1 Tax=Paragonimus heterotremus TaxID=100268 RepID=A0A8J4TI77_9TREM|nr:hypothetical protein PHET_04977 [Paragonimus heterotremus]